MTYLEGSLELMSTSPEHERLKTIIGRLIEAFAEEADLDLNGFGAATFRKEAAARGLEPDECYTLEPWTKRLILPLRLCSPATALRSWMFTRGSMFRTSGSGKITASAHLA